MELTFSNDFKQYMMQIKPSLIHNTLQEYILDFENFIKDDKNKISRCNMHIYNFPILGNKIKMEHIHYKECIKILTENLLQCGFTYNECINDINKTFKFIRKELDLRSMLSPKNKNHIMWKYLQCNMKDLNDYWKCEYIQIIL